MFPITMPNKAEVICRLFPGWAPDAAVNGKPYFTAGAAPLDRKRHQL